MIAIKKERMSLASCIGLILGACIGSAVFSISGITVLYAGGSAVISWAVAALIFFTYGILLSELAIRFKDSGGIYVFPKRAFGGAEGRFWGFISAWGYIVSNIIAIGFSAIYTGVYLNSCFPAINATAASVSCMIIALLITLPGSKRTSWYQNILTTILIITIVLYCVCSIFGGNFNLSNFDNFFSSGTKGSAGFVSAIPLALIAYGASVVIPFMAAEVKNPQRNIPLSLILGLGSLAVIYSLIVFSVVGTVPRSLLEENETLRYIPLQVSAANGSNAVWLTKLVSISAAIALLTTITALMRVNARAMQSMALDGYIIDAATKENKSGALPVALFMMTGVGIVLCFLPQFTSQMINLGAILNIVTMGVSCASLIVARRKYPAYRGFKAPIGVDLSVIVIAIFVACYVPEIIEGGLDMFAFTCAVYALGGMKYIISRDKANRRISGTIVHGKGRGRIFDMPTANLKLYEGQELPKYGVWKTKVFVLGDTFTGLTNVGLRPTEDISLVPTVETYIPEFNGDLYDQKMTLQFDKYIRETKKFENLEQLRKQIDEDIRSIR